MKNWLSNVKFLWSLIVALSAGLIYFISLVRSYAPEMNRLKLENMKQDSTITFQEIEIERLKEYSKKDKDEFNNVYDPR
ncbi:secreted protein, partial [sediment metagenome]